MKIKIKKGERIELLKAIIRELQEGGQPEALKRRFAKIIRGVSASEIAEMEQRLIAEGLPEEEVKRLCNVHVLMFQDALEEEPVQEYMPGHPLHTLTLENQAAEKILVKLEEELKKIDEKISLTDFEAKKQNLLSRYEELKAIDKHYLKKENQLFPRLEARGFSGPSKVMGAIHDDIRAGIKAVLEKIKNNKAEEFKVEASILIQMIKDMIYKEEKILFPLSLEILNETDWFGVKKGEEEVGYAWVRPAAKWPLKAEPQEIKEAIEVSTKEEISLELDTGKLTPKQVNALLKHLPVDVTFVDENDVVCYYSQTKERIFPRSPGVIGRKVQNCHPPQSIHRVNRLLDAFKNGEKDGAEFWIQGEGKFIHIRYFAIRDETGKYLGCLEVSQEVSAIRGLQGERRLLDWG